MATKTINFKMDAAEILEMKKVASVFNISLSDMIREAIKEHIGKLKKDPFYRLTTNVEDASPEESAEILAHIDALSPEDLEIAYTEDIYEDDVHGTKA